jgi:hypothetical protein
MAMRKISMGAMIAVAVTGLFLTMLTAGVLTSSQTVQSGGTITAVNVGVYSDSGCTQNCTSIDWGTLEHRHGICDAEHGNRELGAIKRQHILNVSLEPR